MNTSDVRQEPSPLHREVWLRDELQLTTIKSSTGIPHLS
jgi:hypothetical protein